MDLSSVQVLFLALPVLVSKYIARVTIDLDSKIRTTTKKRHLSAYFFIQTSA